MPIPPPIQPQGANHLQAKTISTIPGNSGRLFLLRRAQLSNPSRLQLRFARYYTNGPRHLSIPLDEGGQTVFCRTGVPDIFWSDEGPQFTSEKFQDFAKQWGFTHITFTLRYPQSKGKIEAMVKSMKKLLRTSWNG